MASNTQLKRQAAIEARMAAHGISQTALAAQILSMWDAWVSLNLNGKTTDTWLGQAEAALDAMIEEEGLAGPE